MDKRGRKVLTLIVFAIIAVTLFAWYWHINSSYPYYFIWDMDHIAALDTLLINSEMLPDHIWHTGFGMYLVLGKTTMLGQAAGAVSAANLSEVTRSLNPILTTAELTGFIRAHQPFLILAIGLLLSVSLYLLFDIGEWIMPLGLAVIGASEAFTYHASMIRTELYSVFFWAAAVPVSIAATQYGLRQVRSGRTAKATLLYITSGLLLGLSFTTKVQSLFYLAETGILILLLHSIYYRERYEKNSRPAKSKWPIWAGLFNWVVFLVLIAAAYLQEMPDGVPKWARGFGIMLGMLFFVTLFGLFVFQVVLVKEKYSYEWYRRTAALNYMALGFMLSFFLHFAIYTNIGLSWQYLLLDYKMIFLRDTAMFALKDFGTYLEEFVFYIKHNPAMFAVLCILNIIAAVQYKKGQIKKTELVLTLLMTTVVLVNILIGTRYILRDTLWKETITNFWILFLAVYALKNSTGKGLIKFVVITALILLVSNMSHTLMMPGRIDANYNLYGWQQEKFFGEVYSGNQKIFDGIIRSAYSNKMLREAKQQADDYKRIKRTAEFVFANQDITSRNIGIAREGFGICTEDAAWRLADVPQALRGTILVDNSGTATKSKFLLKEKYITQNHEYMDKFEDQHYGDNEIAVLGRSDLAIFLFATEDDVNGLINYNTIKTPFKITAIKGDEKMEFTGAEIKHYAKIPREKLKGRYFFVICKL